MTAALLDDVVRGSWVRKTETPTNKEALALLITNLSAQSDSLILSRDEPRTADASGAEPRPLRVVYHSRTSGQHGAELLTTRNPWPVSVYFTSTDAGVIEESRSTAEGSGASTPAFVWDRDVVLHWHRAIRRRMFKDAAFAWAVEEPGGQVRHQSEFPTPVADEFAERTEAGRVISELRRNLQLSIDDISATTGISRRTLFLWQSGRVTPRSSTMRPLWRLHALTRAVVEILDVAGVRSWLHAGDPSPFDQLVAGRMDLVEDEANRIIFRQPSLRPLQWEGARPEADDETVVSTRRGVKTRRSERTIQRPRLGESHVRRRD